MGIADVVMGLLAGRSWRVASQAAAQPSEPLSYPARVELNGEPVDLRLMRGDDNEAMLAFARTLPAHDLLFLRRDITRTEVVDQWARDIEEGRYQTVVALRGEEIIGYATVASAGLDWTRHVAELRVLVSPTARGLKLGRVLTEQAFALAREHGVIKMLAQMTTDQRAAIRVFGHIGFEKEARLRRQLIDRNGELHDLQIMSINVEEFRAKLDLMAISAQQEMM